MPKRKALHTFSLLIRRRDFLFTSAGYLATLKFPGILICKRPKLKKKQYKFIPYNKDKPLAPIIKITPDDGYYIHTYFDVTPFSPSGRYLAVTKLPFQDRMPILGDLAEICIIDVKNETIETVYKTKCWGYQTGANVNWGSTDQYLYANDVINGTAVCIRIDLMSDNVKAYTGPLYHIAPDESCIIGLPHEYRDITQFGYGVPPKNYKNIKILPPGASKNQGIWKTDLKTNKKRLLVSIADIAAKVPEPPPRKDYTYYFWHSKFNKQGTRIYQVLRCIYSDFNGSSPRNPMVFTFDANGSNIKFTSPGFKIWEAPGGHPNWHPNGDYIIRNFKTDEGEKRIFMFRYDGKEIKQLSKKIKGSGHPSIEPRGKFIITDDRKSFNNKNHVILRLIDLSADKELMVCRLPTLDWEKMSKKALYPDGRYVRNVFRLDGHPVWDRDYKKVCLQAAPEGKRQLFIVDLSKLIN